MVNTVRRSRFRTPVALHPVVQPAERERIAEMAAEAIEENFSEIGPKMVAAIRSLFAGQPNTRKKSDTAPTPATNSSPATQPLTKR